MAAPCIYTFKGKEYTYSEFRALLADGLLDKLKEDKVVDFEAKPVSNKEKIQKEIDELFAERQRRLLEKKLDKGIKKNGFIDDEDVVFAVKMFKKQLELLGENTKENIQKAIDFIADKFGGLSKDEEKQLTDSIEAELGGGEKKTAPIRVRKEDLPKEIVESSKYTVSDEAAQKATLDILKDNAKKSGKTISQEAQSYADKIFENNFDENGKRIIDQRTGLPKEYNLTESEINILGIAKAAINTKLVEGDLNTIRDAAEIEKLQKQSEQIDKIFAYNRSGAAFRTLQKVYAASMEGDIRIKYNQIAKEARGLGFEMPFDQKAFDDLTPKQQEKIKPLFDALQKYKEKVKADYEARLKADNERLEKEFNEAIEREKGTKPKAETTKRTKAIVKEELEKAREQFRKDIAAMSSGGLQAIGSFSKVVKLAIEYGVKSAKEFYDEFKGDFPKHSEKEIKEAFDSEVKKIKSEERETKRNEALSELETYVKENGISEITKDLSDTEIIRDIVKSYLGELETKDIVGKVKELIKTQLPDVTEKQIKEAYLRKGEFKRETSKELKSEATQAQRELQRTLTLEAQKEALETAQKMASTPRGDVQRSVYEKQLLDEIRGIKDLQSKKRQELKELEKASKELKDAINKTPKSIIEKAQNELDKKIEKLQEKEKKEAIKNKEKELKEITKELEKEYKQNSKSELQKLQDKIDKTFDKIAEQESKIKALEEGKKLWDKIQRKEASVDAELKKVREKLKDALVKAGKSTEAGTKLAREQRDAVIKNHNERVEKLKEQNPEFEKELEKLKINETDVEKQQDKIDDALENIKKLSKNSEIKSQLNDLALELNKEHEAAKEKIQLERALKSLQTTKEQALRKLNSGRFDDTESKYDLKQHADYVSANLEKKKAERLLNDATEKWKEKNDVWYKRAMNRVTEVATSNIISGLLGMGKVTAAAVIKPSADLAVRKVFGGRMIEKVTGIKFNTERATQNAKAEFDSFKKSLLGMSEKKAKELETQTNKKYEDAVEKFNSIQEEMKDIIKEFGYDSKEHKDFLNSDKYIDGVKEFNNAKTEFNKMLIYQFLSGDEKSISEGLQAWKARKDIFKTGSTAFEESRGGYIRKGAPENDKFYDNFIYRLSAFGRAHATLKDISARQAFIEHWLKGVEKYAKEGKELSISEQIVLAERAYDQSYLAGKFQEANFVAKWLREQQSKGMQNKNPFINLASFLTRMKTLVFKIPLNIAKEGIGKYTFGSIISPLDFFMEAREYHKGLTEAEKADYKGFKGTLKEMQDAADKMPPEVADRIKDYASKGRAGIAMFLTGVYLYESGQMSYDEKKHRLMWGGKPMNKLGNAIILHTGLFTPLVLAAVYGEARSNENTTTAGAIGHSLQHLWADSPIGSMLGKLESVPEFLSDTYKSLTTMSLTRDIAQAFEYYDTGEIKKRKPRYDESFLQGLLDDIKLSTGFLMQDVPEKEKKTTKSFPSYKQEED